MTRPWPHETIAVPQRIDGWKVVAAAKLPSGAGPDLYAAVVEDPNGSGYIFYRTVTWRPRTGFEATNFTSLIEYRDAMFLFSQLMLSLLENL